MEKFFVYSEHEEKRLGHKSLATSGDSAKKPRRNRNEINL